MKCEPVVGVSGHQVCFNTSNRKSSVRLSVHAESVRGLKEEKKLKVTVDERTDDVELSKLSHRQVAEQTACFSFTPQIVVFSVIRIRISFIGQVRVHKQGI